MARLEVTETVAMLKGPGRLVFTSQQLKSEKLRCGELLCETLVTAISPGTELAAYSGAPALRSGIEYPRLLGYCNVARVLDAGPESGAIRVGERVLSFASHRSHFTISVDDVLAVIPTGLSTDDAVCAYLFQLGYNAALTAGVRLGSTVVVIGLGVVGLCSVAMSALAGAQVYGVSEHSRSRSLAVEMGAKGCFRRVDLPELRSSLGSDRAHAVITTSNAWSDWPTALELAGMRGTIAVVGFPGRGEGQVPFNPLDSADFYARQLQIVAAGMSPERADSRGFLRFNERDNLARILDWIQAGALRPAGLVSGELPATQLADAYDRLQRREGSPLTYLLRWASY